MLARGDEYVGGPRRMERQALTRIADPSGGDGVARADAWGVSFLRSDANTALLWWVRSASRRGDRGFSLVSARTSLRYDVIDRRLSGSRGAAYLRRQEARLLRYLIARRGVWVSTQALAFDVFDRRSPTDPSSLNLVRQHVFNLRRKLQDVGATPSALQSVPTLGYRLDEVIREES